MPFNTAHKFLARYPDVNQLITEMEKTTNNINQNWKEGSTTWTFEDESQIIICESEVTATNIK